MVKRLLHVGCGDGKLKPLFDLSYGGISVIPEYEETRLDINPDVGADIVADMSDMGDIGEFDFLVCVHALEHKFPSQIIPTLQEFLRVLKPGGLAIITVPNLDHVRPTTEVLYESASGPITGLDMIYGFSCFVEKNPYQQHHCGFIPETLVDAVLQAGFACGRFLVSLPLPYELTVIAEKG